MRYFALFPFLLVILFYNCSSETSNKTDAEQLLDTTKQNTVNLDTSVYDNRFYELILSKDTSNRNLIIFIDPHGNGKSIADKIKSISEKINSNIICLNNIENNIPNYIELINKDIADFTNQTSIKPDNIYLVGFSGGARMAYAYANSNNIAGILMCGAGLGRMLENHTKYPIAFIAGDGDFNYNEQYYSPFSDIAKNKKIISLSFTGKHEWPNKDMLLFAINFIKNNKKAFNYKDLMNDFYDLQKHNKPYASFKKIEAINKIFATKQTEKDFEDYKLSVNLIHYTKNFEKSLQQEYDRNNRLANSLPSEDWNWWNNKIDEIDNIIKTSEDKMQTASYQRTRAYLGIIMYSVTSREIKNTSSKNIQKYLKIYEKLEPNNPDLIKFKDIYLYQTNN